ncbi:hypothetical protein HN695_00760 [Candidatus Woesearchaeota archaeon]|jgi:hypothetical protein|nr:hypothetical protein [Candidatus Woesearchaeota archaeon]MBT5272796.1 hypothetical protein [Candidatus Woesearchaeota archaeon]MBT6040408.1 hypothetical protein [Candidatus Woesearchaeota archaeon]MBT6336959.1 hypothetical protein [Candidatus Woesearchaeota archaeon]MBT7926845.1 hypothetical protein [Candidatus Woesearchaeota archaeon]
MTTKSLDFFVSSFVLEESNLRVEQGNSVIEGEKFNWVYFAWSGEKSKIPLDLQLDFLAHYFGQALKQPNDPVRIPTEFVPFFNELHKGGSLYGNLLVNAGVVQFDQLLDSLAAQDSIRGVPGPRVLVDLTVSQVPYAKKEHYRGMFNYEIARLTPYTPFQGNDFESEIKKSKQRELACKVEVMGFYSAKTSD